MEQTKRQRIRAVRWMAGTCGLLGMVFAAQVGWAQQVANHASPGTQSVAARPSGPATPVTRSAGEEAASNEPKKHGGEGITVHGHWTIEAHNPDGTLASHVEFENSLSTPGGGDMMLALLLTGEASAADWAIVALGGGAPAICSTNALANCDLVSSLTGPYGSIACGGSNACTPGLNLTYVPATPPTSAGLQLQGNFTVVENGTIASVLTNFAVCTSGSASYVTVSPAACVASNGSNPPAGTTIVIEQFTGTNLPTPMNYTAGQIVSLTVNISFS
jgi:hypothetical protein